MLITLIKGDNMLKIFITLTLVLGFANAKMMFQSVPMDKATILQEGKNKMYCQTCGMTLPMFYKTNHAGTIDGHTKQYCSIHCAVMVKDLKKMDLKDIKVVDTNSLKFIDAETAHYVIGSNKKGTMTMVSKYAFADKSEAEAFAKENGGRVAGFKEAWEAAKKDFSPAMMEKMKAKRALMAKKGEGIYKTKCKQTELPKFGSVADVKSYIKESNICGDLKGKPLQVLGIYLFTKK
jgi:nitrous oxide reductase accessory protein NosL